MREFTLLQFILQDLVNDLIQVRLMLCKDIRYFLQEVSAVLDNPQAAIGSGLYPLSYLKERVAEREELFLYRFVPEQVQRSLLPPCVAEQVVDQVDAVLRDPVFSERLQKLVDLGVCLVPEGVECGQPELLHGSDFVVIDELVNGTEVLLAFVRTGNLLLEFGDLKQLLILDDG